MDATLLNWLTDQDVVAYSRQKYQKHTLENLQSFWLSFCESEDLYLKITTKRDGKMIGTMTAYFNDDKTSCDIGILIGEKNVWGSGYGFQAWELLMNFLFANCQLKSITGGCDIRNKRMINIFRRSKMMEYARETIQMNRELQVIVRYKRVADG